jgi:sigma-B regulation protein RsbU (phosphoserine phosphatase)
MSGPASIPEATIELVKASGHRQLVPVTQSPFLIARGAEAAGGLQFSDEYKYISRRCAALVYAEGEFRLEDRGQLNGLFVNGEKIDNRTLRDGDRITFGRVDSLWLIFHLGSPPQLLPQFLSRLEQASTLEPGARNLRHLSLLLEATALLHSSLPLEDVLGAMVDRAMAITHADRGLLLEADPQRRLCPLLARQRSGKPLPIEAVTPSQTAIARALEQARGVVEQDLAQATAALRDAASVAAQQLRAVIAIPLFSGAKFPSQEATGVGTPSELLGVLYLDSLRPTAFSHLDRQILDALALEATSVLDNARLVEKVQQQRRFEQELEIARKIQQGLLPDKSFQPPPQFEVTGVNRPCLAVGGDYYDLLELSPDRIAFVIADVSGKGLGGALLTSMLQGNFSAMALGQDPARVFAHVNRFICEHSKVERYATLFFGILDSTGGLEFINAGHPSPLLIRAGRVTSPFAAECLPLGLFPESEFKIGSSTLEVGDTLVLFTDGITEALNPEDEQFGVDRLAELVARHAGSRVKELESCILQAVEDFSGGADQADDSTLLVVRYQGTV